MTSTLSQVFAALRPKQWTKNAVVLAPLVFAAGDPARQITAAHVTQALAAAAIFCVISSGIYVMNDLRDIDQDRAHPAKRHRPFASGALGVSFGTGLAVFLLAAGLASAFWLDRQFALAVSGYIVLQVVYSFGLKKIALVDVMMIAAGFVLRAIAGGVVIHVPLSPWLLLCTLLLALFLALCKRRHELLAVADNSLTTRHSLRAYDQRLLDVLIPMVGSAALLAYSLYTLWPDTVAKFGSHKMGFTIPFVIFGLFRYLDLVYRRELGDRPEHILLTDLPLLLNVVLYGLVALLLLLWH